MTFSILTLNTVTQLLKALEHNIALPMGGVAGCGIVFLKAKARVLNEWPFARGFVLNFMHNHQKISVLL